ncbi:MAG: MBL fold metallo-hydrolase [Marinilabiliales bacterium]|nr:MBL fold metallo-hydrolase [Marinilabiliales bacterium]
MKKPDNSGRHSRTSMCRRSTRLPRLDAVVLTHAHLDHCALIPSSTSTGTKAGLFNTPDPRPLGHAPARLP